jgi:glycosyltransferase involved in cell wall biosynthesis
MKLLFFIPSLPFSFADKDRFTCLADHGISGDIVVGWGVNKDNDNIRKLISHVQSKTNKFKYHIFLTTSRLSIFRSVLKAIFYLYKGTILAFTGKHDVIVSYGTQCSGLVALIISLLLRVPFVVIVAGNPYARCESLSYEATSLSRFKTLIQQSISKLVIRRANHLQLLYPTQIKQWERSKNNISIFHDYASIESIVPSNESDKYILFLGYPWYLKGVDILIKAFNKISSDFPDYKLKIVGWCTDKRYYEGLVQGNTNIELCDPVYFEEAMDLMRKCYAFVLPSRSEAMGRVLLEAMAFEKPIVASNVDGIPYIIRDGYNGLLFENEDVNGLADKLNTILSSTDYAKYLAKNGLEYMNTFLTPERYGKLFTEMIHQVVATKP